MARATEARIQARLSRPARIEASSQAIPKEGKVGKPTIIYVTGEAGHVTAMRRAKDAAANSSRTHVAISAGGQPSVMRREAAGLQGFPHLGQMLH